ncbi:HAMP domain-containing methyl-accepting chemotaxis protein, partial [Rhodobacter maris]
MNLSLKAKLIGAFGILLLMIASLGGIAILQMSRINDQSTAIVQNWLPSVSQVRALNTIVAKYRVGEYAHILQTDNAGMERIDTYLQGVLDELKTTRAAYEALISSPEEQKLYNEFSAQLDAYFQQSKRILTLSRSNQNELASSQQTETLDEFNALAAALTKLVEINVKGADDASAEGDVAYAAAQKIILAVITVALIVGIATAVVLIRGIMRSLGGEPDYARDIIREIAGGNLEIQVATRKGDEESLLAAARDMVAKLSEVITEVTGAVRNVDTGSQELSAAAEQLSQGSTEQASSTEEASSAME